MSGPQPLLQNPSCPPYWLMSGSAQESCRAVHRSSDAWGPGPRPRSHSLNSADARWLHQRTVTFLISDSEDEDGYCEDNEGSSSEDARHRRGRERPRGESTHHHPCVNRRKPESPHSRGRSAPSLRECRQPVRASAQQRSQVELPKKSSRRRERSLKGRNFPQSSAPAHPSSCRLLLLQKQQQQRPSSAGALVKSRRQVRSLRKLLPRSSPSSSLDLLPSSPGPEVGHQMRTFL